jgi:hypothetical protein
MAAGREWNYREERTDAAFKLGTPRMFCEATQASATTSYQVEGGARDRNGHRAAMTTASGAPVACTTICGLGSASFGASAATELPKSETVAQIAQKSSSAAVDWSELRNCPWLAVARETASAGNGPFSEPYISAGWMCPSARMNCTARANNARRPPNLLLARNQLMRIQYTVITTLKEM